MGIIFATAGSAVGLGNIWHFPTTCGKSGGAAFILLYLAITICLGLPGMLCEFIIGRNGGRNSFISYSKAGGKKIWGGVGILGMLCSSIIFGFYSVIAGWCLYYLYLAVTGQALGTPEHVTNTFTHIMAPDNYVPMILSVIFILLTLFIIIRGVRKGIELASKIMVPTLIFLLIMLIGASLTLPNAWSGIEFLFHPDFSVLTPHTVFMSLGEAFFSLSMGTACLTTYASYFNDKTNLTQSTIQIVAVDILVAIMAGLMIFPAAFSVGVEPDAGPSLVFMTMPNVFQTAFAAPVAYVVSVLFYLLLTIAALTSTISMLEIGTAVVAQQLKISRTMAASSVAAVCSVIAVISAYSMSHPEVTLFDLTLFDCFDQLTANIMMPLGAMLTFIVVGWVAPKEMVMNQLTNNGQIKAKGLFFAFFYLMVRYCCPVFIILIFLNKIGII